MSTVGSRPKSFRRRRRLFSLAVVSRPGKKQHPLCTLCLCGESSIRLPWASIMRRVHPGTDYRLEVAKGKSLDHLQLGRGRLRLGEVTKYVRRRIHLLTSILW